MSREMSTANGHRAQGAARPDLPALKRRYLSTIEMFSDLSPQQVAALEGEIRMSNVPAGRMVFAPEETGEGLFILKQGAVQIYRISPEGKRFVIANIEPGTFFGEMAFAGQSMYGSFAETMQPSLLCVMSRVDLERLIAKYPSVGLRMMQALAGRLGDAESQLEDLALKSLSARLATFILRQTSGGAGQMGRADPQRSGRARRHLARNGDPGAERTEGRRPHRDRSEANRSARSRKPGGCGGVLLAAHAAPVARMPGAWRCGRPPAARDRDAHSPHHLAFRARRLPVSPC